jgi:benzoate-CoA ligase
MDFILDRAATAHDKLIYTEDWRAWRDPEIPDLIDPIAVLIEKHLGTPIEDKPAIIADGVATSYGELVKLVRVVSAGLNAIDVSAENRVLLFGTDSLDYLLMWFGALRVGAIPTVVSDLYKSRELLYFLSDTNVRFLFIDSEQLPKLLEIASGLPHALRCIVVRGAIPPGLEAQLPGRKIVSFESIRTSQAKAVPAHARHSNDVAYMFYSGGTTGTAKGITHLAYDFMLVPERQGHFWEYRSSDIVFATSRKYFTHGLWPGALIPLYWGATAVLDRRPPGPEPVLETLEKYAVTKWITVPTILKNVVEHLRVGGERVNLPKLGLVTSASEKISPELFEQFFTLFGIELFDSIGSSEITYEWIANRPKEFRRGSLGKPVFGYEIRLVDADGRDVTEPDVPGEAWVRSRTACFYYWRKYDKSRETFVGPWARTGDNLTFDRDGFFWFSGRGNDVFKVKGLWVSPIEIEAALTNHPAVREAAVISYEDADGLTRPKAYVVLREGFSPDDKLIAQLNEAVKPIGGFKVPGAYEFIGELPRTTLLKIDRRALREASVPRK